MKPIAIVILVAACGSSSPTPAQSADVDAYRREQAACVAEHDTREAIDACRAKVRAAHPGARP